MEVTQEYLEIKNYLTENESGFVFLTGKAGSGKTTFLKWFLRETRMQHIILAPTGIAALNAGGQTIHSFFKFGHYMDLDYKPINNPDIGMTVGTADVVIIDEISMVRADIIDNIDISLRRNLNSDKPFGGKLILAIGDLCQLPPVLKNEERIYFDEKYNSPYFFSGKVFQKTKLRTFELTKIFRQSDPLFISFLNNVRSGILPQNTVNAVNNKLRINSIPKDFEGTVLCTMNKPADNINSSKLEELSGQSNFYHCVKEGKIKDLPAPEMIELKVNTKVLFCKNTSEYKNGETGIVIGLNKRSALVLKLDGYEVLVRKETWEAVEYINGVAEVVGKFHQLPLKLGWAITIHKSQGMTFSDEIIIDTGNGCFASGQFYVAMSRITDPKNVKLLRTLKTTDIKLDYSIKDFLNE